MRSVIAIPPEHVTLQPGEEEAENTLTGTLNSTSFVGNSMDCVMSVGDQPFRVMLHPERTPAVGSACTLYVAARHCLAMRSDRS